MWGKFLSKITVPILLVILLTSFMTAFAAESEEPVFFDGTGNYYMAVSTEAISWSDASAAAAQLELPEGCTSSHLAVITDSSENDFLADMFANKWLGAFQADDATEVDEGWQWLTGEAFEYNNWHMEGDIQVEPNDSDLTLLEEDHEEDYLDGHDEGGWNDDSHDSLFNTGYVVEFECDEPPPVLDCSAAAPSIDMIWPPNHNMQPVTINGVAEVDAITGEPTEEPGEITVLITAVGSSEADNGRGDGNTTGDFGGSDTDTAWVRAERSGNGDGRTYTIDFEASSESATGCTGSVSVFVPHDRRGGNANNNSDESPGRSGDAPGQSVAAEASANGQAQREAHAGGNNNNAGGNGNGRGNNNAGGNEIGRAHV